MLVPKWCWQSLIPDQDPEKTKLRWAFFYLPVQDSLCKTNVPTSVPAKAPHTLPAPPPTLSLHIPCFFTVLLLLFPLLHMFPVLSHCSHLLAPTPLLPFISLLSSLPVTTNKVLCKDHSAEHLPGTGNWLVNYRALPLQFVKSFKYPYLGETTWRTLPTKNTKKFLSPALGNLPLNSTVWPKLPVSSPSHA